jgi:hypothetical protein
VNLLWGGYHNPQRHRTAEMVKDCMPTLHSDLGRGVNNHWQWHKSIATLNEGHAAFTRLWWLHCHVCVPLSYFIGIHKLDSAESLHMKHKVMCTVKWRTNTVSKEKWWGLWVS